MSSVALKGYGDILVTNVRELEKEMSKRAAAEEIINISDWMSFFGYESPGSPWFNRHLLQTKISRSRFDLMGQITYVTFLAY